MIIKTKQNKTVGHGAGKHGVKYNPSLPSLKSLYLFSTFLLATTPAANPI